jgi:hypothetical protein
MALLLEPANTFHRHPPDIYNVKSYLYPQEADARNTRQPGSRRTFLPKRGRRPFTFAHEIGLGML